MTDQKLIDALAKITCAIEGRTHGFALDEVVAPGIERWMRHRHEAESLLRDIRDAGYAFEKAHTPAGHAKESDTSTECVNNGADSSHVAPTDDERLDIISAASAAFKARGGAPDWEEDAIARDLIIRWHLRGFEDGLAAGFRRFAVPEPSTEHGCDLGEDCDGRCNEVAGETPGLISCPCGWSRIGLFRQLHEHQRSHESEPQGEPSDAQVYAALDAWLKAKTRGIPEPNIAAMRAALDAAGGVR